MSVFPGENSGLEVFPDYVPFYLWQSRNWIKRDFQREKAKIAQQREQKVSFKSNCLDYVHVISDFSGLLTHLMLNAKEQ